MLLHDENLHVANIWWCKIVRVIYCCHHKPLILFCNNQLLQKEYDYLQLAIFFISSGDFKIINSLVQLDTWMLAPKQGLPPLLGFGLSHDLDLHWQKSTTGSPSIWGHLLHGAHSDHPPSSVEIICYTLINHKNYMLHID